MLSKELAPNVYLAYDDFAQNVVIKKLPHKAGCSGLPKEALAGMILNHENVVRMQDYFQDEDNTYLVLEFIEGKDLFTFVQQRQFAPLDEEMARHAFIQLLEAVAYSHSVGVVHLDIKLENIILSSNSVVKLIDFGLCDIVKTASESIQCWVGSLDYACPEIYLRKPYEASKADVFSLGVVLYILLSGELPFSREERTDCLRVLGKHPQIVWPSQCKASTEAKDLLIRMMEFNGEQRISLDDIFHHKWVKLPQLDD